MYTVHEQKVKSYIKNHPYADLKEIKGAFHRISEETITQTLNKN